MSIWALTATVKAAPEKLAAFVAYHLDLGAEEIWLYFDDPEDPCFPLYQGHPRIRAQICTDAYWEKMGGRPETHQQRQVRNARRSYRRSQCKWLAHIDVDEFIYPLRPLDPLLEDLSREQIMVRMRPYEAMHDPALPDDIYSARLFRAAFSAQERDLAQVVMGKSAAVLPSGMLSHSAGKAFFRTGIKDLAPRIHGAFRHGERLEGPEFQADLALLHFHAQDPEAWQRALPFRLEKGAYQFNPRLQAYLKKASPQEIERFYRATQMLTPAAIERLSASGHLISADLALRARLQ